MKKYILILMVPLFLYAHTLPELFSALKSHSQTKSDEIAVKIGDIRKDTALAELYPKINLFATYDNYSTPTSMIPVPPDKLVGLVKDPSKPSQPFSYNIYKEGATVNMPIFVKSIYSMADYATALQKSAKAKKRINIIKNEALIVGANANFIYLVALKKALDLKEKSLLETQKTIKIKVENGRAPASALYKINDGLNQIAISKNSIEIESKSVISSIESLTGIVVNEPIKMQKNSTFSKNEFASLEPLRKKLYASRINIKAQKEKLYPALFAHGTYSFSQAEAYNNYENVNEEYGNIGVTLNIPLLTMSQYSNISLAKLELKSSQIALDKSRDELQAKSRMLEDSLPLLENSKELYKKSIRDKKKLLAIAKVNYTTGRLSTEEYLRYEDDVVAQVANLYKTEATWWQTVMQLAVIYANDIEEIVQ